MMLNRHPRPADVAVAALACLLLSSPVFPAPPADALRDYSLQHWEEDDGLDLGFILAITQDSSGYLWLGTSAGVVRFDGIRFRSATDLGLSLGVGEVNALRVTRDGTMWVGYVRASGPGENFLSRVQNGNVTHYGMRDGLEASIVNILETKDGTVWASSLQGLFRFRGERWERVPIVPELPAATVGGLFEDDDDNLWVGAEGGIFRLRSGGQAFERLSDFYTVTGDFAQDAAGRMWITSATQAFEAFPRSRAHEAPAMAVGRGWKLLVDHRNNLWVATYGQGLWRVDVDGDVSAASISVLPADAGFAATLVRTLFEDRERNIWVGTANGLYRLSPRHATSIVTNEYVSAMAASGEEVWLGTSDGKLARVSGRTATPQTVMTLSQPISAVHSDRRGTTWVSVAGSVFTVSDGQVIRVGALDRAFQEVVSLASDADGNLFIVDVHRGVYQWNGRELSMLRTEGPRLNPTSIVLSDLGRLLIGSNGADLAVRERDGTWHHYTSGTRLTFVRTSIHEDSDGTVWFGGIHGLSRLRGGTLQTLGEGSGFPRTLVSAIVMDDLGYIWCATPAGILRADRADLDRAFADPSFRIRYRTFTTTDGTAGIPWSWTRSGPTAVRGRDGDLWFVTSRGVTVIDPRAVMDQAAPLVRIDRIIADNQPVDMAGNPALSPKTSRIQIDFSSLTLTNPTRTRFRYRLDGFDTTWQDSSVGQPAAYTNLPPGQYRFRVTATRNDIDWSPREAVLEFTIDPAFYQMAPFQVGVAGLAIAAVGLAWQLRVRRIRERLALLGAERMRIARDIHDRLLQDLFAVRLQLDDLTTRLTGLDASPHTSSVLDRLSAIREQVDGSVRETRDTVWGLRQTHHDLPAALDEIGHRAIAGTGVALELKIVGRRVPLDPVMQEQLLQIGREAITNAVRHARADRVTVTVHYEARQVSIRVVDDGVGFDQRQQSESNQQHFGLAIMRERTEALGGRFDIVTSTGRGTAVTLTVPLPTNEGYAA